MNNNLTLYCIVRYLPKTMNAGKGMAQVHHAGTHLVAKYGKHPDVKKYLTQANGFGTTITLQSQEADAWERTKSLVSLAKSHGFVADIITDPTYPVDFGVTIPLETVAYVLIRPSEKGVVYSVGHDLILKQLREDYVLHPQIGLVV